MIILCTHHKGGVGKTELALHITGVLRLKRARTLLIDCDSQASAWRFYLDESPVEEQEPRQIDSFLSVIWNPTRERLKRSADLFDSFDHFVIDVTGPLENTVQTIIQNAPNLVLIPVNPQTEALTNLKDPLGVIAQLEIKAGHQLPVRIVPLGRKIADIQAKIDQLDLKIADCRIAPKIRNLARETNLARLNRHYIWLHPGCEDLEAYFQDLLSS